MPFCARPKPAWQQAMRPPSSGVAPGSRVSDTDVSPNVSTRQARRFRTPTHTDPWFLPRRVRPRGGDSPTHIYSHLCTAPTTATPPTPTDVPVLPDSPRPALARAYTVSHLRLARDRGVAGARVSRCSARPASRGTRSSHYQVLEFVRPVAGRCKGHIVDTRATTTNTTTTTRADNNTTTAV